MKHETRDRGVELTKKKRRYTGHQESLPVPVTEAEERQVLHRDLVVSLGPQGVPTLSLTVTVASLVTLRSEMAKEQVFLTREKPFFGTHKQQVTAAWFFGA